MEQAEIYTEIYRYLADSIGCAIGQLQTEGIHFARSPKPHTVKILSIRDTDIISLSEDAYALGKRLLTGKTRDELYESTLTFGQTLHYVPDLREVCRPPLPEDFTPEWYGEAELPRLRGIEDFGNSLAFDPVGNTDTGCALCAVKDGNIVAIAGAAAVTDKLMEIGIDVQKPWRGRGLASALVRNLTAQILAQGKIPFYSASVTNLASQAVAIRSGYLPLWTDSYGTH